MTDIHPTKGRRIAGADPAAFPASEKRYEYRAGLTPRRRAELDRLRTELDAQARRPWDEDQSAAAPTAPRPRRPAAAAPPAGDPGQAPAPAPDAGRAAPATTSTSQNPEGDPMPDLSSQGGRSAMGRASDGRAFRPYFPGGRPVRALVAEEFRAAMAPPAREEPASASASVPAPEPEPAPEPITPPATHCKNCGYLTTAIGHQITCEDKP